MNVQVDRKMVTLKYVFFIAGIVGPDKNVWRVLLFMEFIKRGGFTCASQIELWVRVVGEMCLGEV